MPRTEAQNQNIKDKRRAKIVKGAIKVFAEKGIDKVPVDDITKIAKCSHGLFYHYFDNKDIIIEAIVEENVIPNDLVPPCRKAKEAHGIAGLKLFADYYNRVFDPSNGVYNLASIGAHLYQSESLPESLKHFEKDANTLETLKVLIKEGQDQGKVIAGDPNEIALGIYDIIEASFNRLVNGGKKGRKAVSGDVIYNMLLKEARED
ncbi:MAG: TetR/AcrR family transcriptional regulator [Bacilli bacterium]|nr:TetR/AcrR family transcriptional regulator [Bacilli bacterium]